MRRICLLLLFFAPVLLHAQDITGIWQGHFRSTVSEARNSIGDDRYRIEVQVAQRGKLFDGVTYSYLSTYFYGKAAAAGTVNVHTHKVLMQEGKILDFRGSGDICIMTYFLQYSKFGNEEYLEGTYVSMNLRDSGNCGRGTVFLRKVPTSDFYPEPMVLEREKEITDSLRLRERVAVHKPAASADSHAVTARHPITHTVPHSVAHATTPVKKPAVTKHPQSAVTTTAPVHNPPPMSRITVPKASMRQAESDSSGGIGRKFPTIVPGVIKDRENPTVKTLVVNVTEITLNIYDDGAIDNDTVSVYVDNKPVLLHRMLTDRPLVVTLHLDEDNAYHEVVMVADNEGEIPPNTSLMIVKAGDKEYEVRITSTEQKNAVVKFRYEK